MLLFKVYAGYKDVVYFLEKQCSFSFIFKGVIVVGNWTEMETASDFTGAEL